jgi:hypothetical protein
MLSRMSSGNGETKFHPRGTHMIIGRNDPCPCGSGKKYKKCCLQKDVASAPRKSLDFGYESDLTVRRKAIDKLDALLRETVYQDEVAEFIEEFWNPIFVDEDDFRALRADAEARGPLERQLPQAIRNAFLIDESFPAPYLLAHAPDRFTPAERDFLGRFADARITFIQLREFFPEAGYTLVEDLFDGREYKLFDKAFSQSGSPHAIVSARLVPLPDGRGHVLEQVGLGIFFPEDKAIIVEALEDAVRHFGGKGIVKSRRGKVPPEAIHALLRDEPMFVYEIEILMACRNRVEAPPSLANTDGDPLIQIEARYRCDDPRALMDALLAQRNISHETADGAEVFAWVNRQDTLLGLARLYPKRGELVAETNSRARHRKWEKKLQSLGRLTLLEKREAPMDFETMRNAAPADGDGPWKTPSMKTPSRKSPLPAEEMAALLPQIKAQLAERWLKEKIPDLGGKTPVQAAKTPQGRKQLKELFAYIESMEARRPAGAMDAGWDVGEMKKRLGLPGD